MEPSQVSPAATAGVAGLAELSDAVYFAKVLQLPLDKSESSVEAELVARARELGISASLFTQHAHRQQHADKRYTSSAESASTVQTSSYHGRTFSTASDSDASTAPTIHSSTPPTPSVSAATKNNDSAVALEKRPPRGREGELSFSPYEKYVAKVGAGLDQPKALRKSSLVPAESSSRSMFSVSTRRSFVSLASGLKSRIRWRRKSILPPPPNVMSCICCRDDYRNGPKTAPLHSLPCGHTYCSHCLRIIISQSMSDEAKMPPRCCAQPIPGSLIRSTLTRDSQQAFLKAVALYSTPWKSRIFCPNADCGEFIPPRSKVDPKSPLSVACQSCHTRVCVTCRRNAHPVGKDCPEDRELKKVLRMDDKSGWRRCYKCRSLVEPTQGRTHLTCRCRAQFCYTCGGVWDPAVGCPNVCSGEEELERRRAEEDERAAEVEAEGAAQEQASEAEITARSVAESRSRSHPDFQKLTRQQQDERDRFVELDRAAKDALRRRHDEQRAAMADRHMDQQEKMKERHIKTAGHLEDRQVAAELELRVSLEQSERSVRIRLKHMEAYCEGLGRSSAQQQAASSPSGTSMPQRTVTERDLRELGQQYNLRDNMERMHQSKINVMRDRQAKRMEELLDRQEAELATLTAKGHEELDDLAARFAHETDAANSLFAARADRLRRRWDLAMDILLKEVQGDDETVRYARLPVPQLQQ
ncbi:IBR domain [Geosmithia morbida]|uniref:RBR-type E3 ubiquitin transferase n=1 Tax=Geosmithia morbida TaxID=1094350 RepID=A0A9P4YWW0_9HYPO|nr:IBR domain [Geosmithia morbida]KAF4124568.1 IBR domain [Geosmithia morbida]